MDLLEKIDSTALKMEKEQQTLRDHIQHLMRINVTDAYINEGVDRLIYNHSESKATLRKVFGLTEPVLNNVLAECYEKELIGDPIIQGRTHLYSRYDIESISNHIGFEKYSDKYEPAAIVIQSPKGGVGKSTTTLVLAAASALDLSLNAKVIILDLDPQGTSPACLINSAKEDSLYLTTVDFILSDYEPDGNVSALIEQGYEKSDIIKNAAFSTHLPNLDVLPAFPADERLVDTYWELPQDERDNLISKLADEVIPALKEKYDLIIIDTPPQSSPLMWSALNASEFSIIPVIPHEFDFASTLNFTKTLPRTVLSLPSQGKNLRELKYVLSNYDPESKESVNVEDKMIRTTGDLLIDYPIYQSELFVAASRLNRTIFDIKKSERICSSKQFDIAMDSSTKFYKKFIKLVKKNFVKG
ncbi:ParA family protein [Photobacterium leiognathi]|uniref:ParA family protein n=1 Tax=Photobacterium leiognathi TaxID=553611 RepID=UPI001EDCFA77|nr:ParA family protein [Photobacterium leiognathi]MCG3883715.1 ParA family protein [Photobacterium leiognathi]